MTMDATGRFLLVAHGDTSITNYSNDVVVLALDPSTGSLRKVSSAKAGDGPASIAALATSE
jgi:6-phosphogluconolactonase (cycloisomerase 2 family)